METHYHDVSPAIKQMQHDTDYIGVQPNQQEAATVPRRSRRRSLARLFAKSSNSDTAACAVESFERRDGGYDRSASLPPKSHLSLRHSEVASGQSEESGRTSLSAFLSFKKKQASLTAALAAFDGKRASTESCMSSVTMTEEKDGDDAKSVNSCQNVPCQSSALLTAISSSDDRFDLVLNPVGTVDFDEILSEQRQSPEPFHSGTSLTQCCSPSPQQELLAPTLESSDCALGLLRLLRVLGDTLCTSAGTAVASRDAPTTTLIKYYESMPEKTHARLLVPRVSTHFSTDLKPDKSNPETTSETLSVDVDELQACKDCEEKEVTYDIDPEANCTDANGDNGDIDVGVEFDVCMETIGQINAIHDALLDSERHCQTDPLLERASSPRTDILNQHGWSQHHRYARHRQSSTENPSIMVLPLNHMSRALVVNGRGGGMNGLHHGLVKSSSAKDLTELRALTDELRELRTWRALATKSLDTAREELKAMASLRSTRAAALDEAKKLRLEVDVLRKEASLLTTMLNDRKLPLSNVTNEGSMVASSERILKVESDVIKEIEAEKEHISMEMVLTSSELVLESKHSLLGEDLIFADLQEQSRVDEIKQKEFILLEYESSLLANDTAKLETALAASNQARDAIANELNELKVRHATVEIRLGVEQKARLNGNEKLVAAKRDIRSLQEKSAEGDSELQEMKDRLDTCQLENEDLVKEITALRFQLQHTRDCKCQLDQKLKEAEESVAEKHREVSFLATCVKSLQDQLQETEESFRRKLMDEQGPMLGEIQRLKAALFAKEKEISHLKDDLTVSLSKVKRVQDDLDGMNVMAQTKAPEIENLRAINQKHEEIMNEMKNECGKMRAIIIDQESEISFLRGISSEQKQVIDGLNQEIADCIDDRRCLEQKLLIFSEERNSFQADAASKFSSQKTTIKQATIASEIFEQRIRELERELGRQQAKYQSATDALAGMEVALLVRPSVI